MDEDNNKNNRLYVCYSLTSCKKDNIISTTNEIKQQHKDYKIAVSNKDKAVKWVNARKEEYAQYRRLKTKGERNSFLKKHPLLEKTMLYGNDVGYEELEVLE
jgi:NMD protein affecting ribosome stability and mRNA decay